MMSTGNPAVAYEASLAEIVRVGPNELAFRSPEAMHDIYMAAEKNRETFVKTEFQHLGKPPSASAVVAVLPGSSFVAGGDDPGITAEPDPERHRELAKQMAPAFSPRSMQSLEPDVHRYVDLFIQKIGDKGGLEPCGIDMRTVVIP